MRDVHDLLASPEWPSIAALEARLTLPGKHLVEQDAALLADGLHYEARIAQGRIATRADNWHDLFNALVWARYLQLKQVLNVQQCRHIASMPPGQRNRAQAALTQFDETGVIVRVRDEDVLAAWDVHDWPALFEPARWQSGDIAIAAIFGHALMEQALLPGRLLVGKCVVVHGEVDDACVDAVTAAIAEGRAVTDPLQLRPLPLAGIPGWHQGQDAAFYADAAYFRPLRAGRQYPPPLHGAM
nr:DUF3025 domain-containing protein [Stenotrophomonas sp. PE591]